MKPPLLFLALCLAAPAAFAAGPDKSAPPSAVEEQSPIKLGVKTAEGFDDPEHLHFFRYQTYLRKNGLEGLDAAAWKNLGAPERAEKIKTGEAWLKDKFSALMRDEYLKESDSGLLADVWGQDVAAAAGAVTRALKLGDPAQIRAAREKVSGLVKNVGGVSVDWNAIFDGYSPGTVAAPILPDPLALKTHSGFLASLQSKEVQAPLASKATFIAFLEKKQVSETAMPALAAMYDVLSRAKEPEKSETAHILPTVVRFLNDGKKIVNEDLRGALAFAVPGDYDDPVRVGITSQARNTDPVEVGSVLSHEFQHIYDMYAGRYYTLDSELRGFKTNVMFLNIMKKDPQMSKKLDELMNSDDEDTRGFFQDHKNIDDAYKESPKAFAEMVAFGHGYNRYTTGGFAGRLTVREASDPDMGLQRQISAQAGLLKRAHAQSEVFQKRLAEIQARSASLSRDKELEKTTSDFADSQRTEIYLRKEIAISTLRLDRILRERSWMDQQAANAAQSPPAYDLSLPIGKDYVVTGD